MPLVGIKSQQRRPVAASMIGVSRQPDSVFYFPNTGEAYDACQTWEDIKNGDVLVIAHEKVVGVADTWPLAVTAESGELHEVAKRGEYEADPAMWRGIVRAVKIARGAGFPIAVLFQDL
jgi:hypothetical protein